MLLSAMRTMASAGLRHGAAEAPGDGGDGPVRGVGVQGHAAAEEVVGVEAAEDQVGVGDGGLGAALAVAGGAGRSAGTLRADAQHAALVDPGERAAAGADGADVDHRDLDRHAPFDLERGGERLLAADHGGDVGRGAAHVERDQMVDAGEAGDVAAGDDAAGGAGDQHLDRGGGGGVQGHLAAVGADDHGVGADAGGIEALAHHAQAAGDDGLEIGVGERGRGPLILLPLGQDLVGDRERQARQLLGQDRLDRLLVGGVEVGEQQADGDRLDLGLGADRGGDGADLGRVERGDDLAIGVDALGRARSSGGA